MICSSSLLYLVVFILNMASMSVIVNETAASRNIKSTSQRWANGVFGTKYEYYSGSWIWPIINTNIIRFSLWPSTNTIRVQKFDCIQIRISFGAPLLIKLEYEYYSFWKYFPDTSTNISIRSQLFEYYLNTELLAHSGTSWVSGLFFKHWIFTFVKSYSDW